MKVANLAKILATAPDTVPYRSLLLDFISEAKPFVFAEPAATAATSAATVIHALPFPICSIEIAGGLPTHEWNNGIRYLSLVVKEKAPGRYVFFGESVDNFGQPGVFTADSDSPREQGIAAIDFVGVANAYFNSIPKQTVCTERVSERIKAKVNGENKFVKIREVIHVRPSQTPLRVGLFGGPIDYSHRFEVRGHWREIAGVGKDREGNYCVSGATWVLPHVKGPESKPLVRKQRVIHETC